MKNYEAKKIGKNENSIVEKGIKIAITATKKAVWIIHSIADERALSRKLLQLESSSVAVY